MADDNIEIYIYGTLCYSTVAEESLFETFEAVK